MYKHLSVRMSDNCCPRGREPMGYKELVKPVVSQIRTRKSLSWQSQWGTKILEGSWTVKDEGTELTTDGPGTRDGIRSSRVNQSAARGKARWTKVNNLPSAMPLRIWLLAGAAHVWGRASHIE